jgi:hypothetical protein
MASLWSRIRSRFTAPPIPPPPPPPSGAISESEDPFWDKVYDARTQYFRRHIGEFPQDILKIVHLFGVWPGGGLYVMPATAIGPDIWAHCTFGLSNADMPTSTTAADINIQRDEQGRPMQTTATLRLKPTTTTTTAAPAAAQPPGAAGYGYEILVLTRGPADWPLGVLQWAAQAELLNDVGILNRVDRYAGLTIEQIRVGEEEFVNVLFAKARPPLPTGTTLPNGAMTIIVATAITAEEMQWSMTNGRGALLDRLYTAGIGQVSIRERASVAM